MFYIIAAMLLYSVAILFATAASRHANTTLVTLLQNSVGIVVPAILLAASLGKKTYHNEKFGIVMALAGGVFLVFFVLAINKAYAVNKVGLVVPVVFGGSLFISTVLSFFIFKEKATLLQTVGLIFLAIGFSTIIYARATNR